LGFICRDDLKKQILSFFVFVSLILLEYSPVKAVGQLNNLSQYGIQFDSTSLSLQIFGIAILHFVILGIIWSIPDSMTETETRETQERQNRQKEKMPWE
jgi:hypothetical protein